MIMTFTKRIAVEANFHPEFSFSEVVTAGGVRFHVSTRDKSDKLCHFTMAEEDAQWKILNAPQPPDWIRHIEKELHAAICLAI